MIFDSTKSII